MNTSKIFGVTRVAACGVALTACNGLFGSATSSSIDLPSSGSTISVGGSAPFLDSKVETGLHAAPVVGGTLLVTRDKKTIVAADPDRDAIFLVDTTSHAVTPIQLQRGDEPGRVAEGPDGTVYVGLRRAGALVAVDVASGSIANRVPVCGSPRGVAYDAKSSSVYVACRSGLLLTLAASDLSLQRSITLDPDLRDVIVRDQDLVVTRFQSAEVMVVGPDGTVSRRGTPQPTPGCATATVLFRALALPGGQIALAHQVSSDDMVNENNGGYGMSSCGGGLVSRVLTTVDVDTPSGADASAGTSPADSGAAGSPPVSMTFQSTFLPSAGPLDVAVDADSGQLALIALDTSLTGNTGMFEGTAPAVSTSGVSGSSPPGTLLNTEVGASLWLVPLSALTESAPIVVATASLKITGQPVAVAFNAGSYVVQSREPATLEFEGGTSVLLSSESHADTGHLIFHMDSGIGISCSSCHPEGGEDGHVWHFPEGLRRTLPLQGGVLERAPFHWDGSLKDMNALFDEVMVKRMNVQASMSDPQIASLGSFLEQLPEPAPADGLDPAAVARGQVLFQRADVGCSTCHSGPQYTNNLLSDVGTGGQFVTPSLLGVGLRTALFHDGCAKSVADRFGPCAGTEHGKPELLSDSERADLITFLRSL